MPIDLTPNFILCPMKNRSCCSTALITTTFTIKKPSFSQNPKFLMITSWSPKTYSPSLFSEMYQACFVSSKRFLETQKTSLLVLFPHCNNSILDFLYGVYNTYELSQ